MSEELKPAAVHDANVFLPGSLGPVRREVVLAYEHDRVVNQLRAELAALKAGQGEAVAEFGSDCIFNLRKQPNGERWPAGTKLYAAPPAFADAVSVPVELLERLADMLANPIHYHPGAIDKRAEELRALLAQSESKG